MKISRIPLYLAMLSCYTVLGGQLSVPYAMIARQTIAFGGTNLIDSFDSQNTNFSSNGQYDPAKARDQAWVLSTSTDWDAILVENARIKGTVGVGAGGPNWIYTNGAVGDAAWITNGNGGIQPGHSFAGFAAAMPDVPAPLSGNPSVPLQNITIIEGNHFITYDFLLSNSGTNFYQIAFMSGNILVAGVATLYVTSNLNTESIYIMPGAALTLYVGGNATIGGDGVINTNGNALNFRYYGLPSNTNLNYSSSSPFSGVIYAPQAVVLFSSFSSVDVTGAIAASSIVFWGSGNFHFDENLSRSTCAGIILAPQLAGNNFTFNFPTLSGQSYTLQQSTVLNQWQDYRHLVGDGTVMQLSAPMTNLGGFFRLSLP
ncbi:MAG: DUF7305 domain-containing protein [Limisphaerales bacterium]